MEKGVVVVVMELCTHTHYVHKSGGNHQSSSSSSSSS
ncbi:hypothetical protein LSH36_1012g00014 [Paralvinella palmiformis]|uniref:Uncharacterized protein n=1 Tax=Paralvinella palmiformis TaxID=53620 RepID=A0AAD9MQ89_9ANNE|nr:hypothetical protein LSH36_1012g00014 [Paralvinella palmiformis]